MTRSCCCGRMRGMSSVLVVDDHAGFRSMARRVLADGGADVVGEVPDAAGVMDAVQALWPDIVLLDIGLPDGDGISVAADLLQLSDPPIVILTSSRQQDDYSDRLADVPDAAFIWKADLTAAVVLAHAR